MDEYIGTKMSDNKSSKAKKASGKKNKANVAANKNQQQQAKVQAQTQVKAAENKANVVKSAKALEKAAQKAAEEKAQKTSSALDKILWIVAFVLIVLAIGGNYYYTKYILVDETSLARLARVAIVILVIVGGLAVTLLTTTGKKLLKFGRDSYVELRKVVWPTRQEAIQTTFIVFIAVSLVSVFLYICDLVFLQIVRVITI